MQLKELISDIYVGDVKDIFGDLEIKSVCCDSRLAQKESLFIAMKGLTHDGIEFLDEVVDKGVRVVAARKGIHKTNTGEGICYLIVEDTYKFLRDIIRRFYGNPSREVKTIGITGTNGKTTTAYLIESILQENKKNCGVIGTINHRIGKKVFPSHNTTPGLLELQKFLFNLVKLEYEYCVMEVSSHALAQKRVDLIDFKSAVFTNLTDEHLDFHLTKEKYFSTKSQLFLNLSSDAAAIINMDDDYGRKLVSMVKAKTITYGIDKNADIMAKNIRLDIEKTHFNLHCNLGNIAIQTSLIGRHNVYNILAAASVCLSEGMSLDDIKKGIGRLDCVPGRLEKIDCQKGYFVFIDYAHTQDALENVLQSIKNMMPDSRIILVFGCGGDRDKAKRLEMGKIACHWADESIITMDNPRGENPQDIIDQIIKGFHKDNFCMVLKREEAICKALEMAQAGDIVLIAGKGHENYQILKDKKIVFDERKIVREFLKC